MGRIAAIWIKRMKRGPMDPVERATLHAGVGLEGNADQGGRRQVTLIDRARWQDAERELGVDVEPTARRANVLTEGVDYRESRGKVVSLGGVRIRIFGETRPCERMNEAHPRLQEALRPEWRAGAYGEVLDDGEIAVGDAASWEESGTA
ncbi:MAG: MOSC domain-containing protein [Acidobacteria bacterium]|nr:MOSC domain-containing protein [Acidobacteriota bacterium]